jgi:hypothetical protein
MVLRKFLSSPQACNEGEVISMYPDNLGNVSTGVGINLEDAAANNLLNRPPFEWQTISNNTVAQDPAVLAEYNRVRSTQTQSQIPDWATMGGGAFIGAAKKLGIVTLELTDASSARLFEGSRDNFERSIKSTPGYEEFDKIPGGFPADAQLGIISIIWAYGPGNWRRLAHLIEFHRMCGARQWGDIASTEKYKWSNIRADRRKTLKQVFQNAQSIEDQRRNSPNTDVTIVSPPYSNLFF